jgi:hypothetical protein
LLDEAEDVAEAAVAQTIGACSSADLHLIARPADSNLSWMEWQQRNAGRGAGVAHDATTSEQ